MALSVDIILNARDEASGHIEKFGKGLRDTTKSIQAAAGSLISELSPALGSMVASMTSAARVAAQLPVILGTMTVGVAVVTAALVPYVSVLVETRRRQVDLNLAVQGLDFQGVSTQAKAAAREFAQFDNTLLGFIRTLTRTEGAFNVLDFLSGRKALEAFRKELEAAAAALAPIESARLSAEGFLKQNEALKDQLQLRQDLARESASEQDFLETANQLAIALQKQADAQERLLRSRAAIRLATPGVTPTERALIEQERESDLLALREQTRAQLGRLGFQTRQGALAIREQRLPPSGLAAGEAPEGEGGEGGLTAAGIARATAAVRASDERALGLERERLSLVQQIPGVLREQQAALDLQLVALERQRLSEAGLLTDAGELNLRLKEQIISMGELERTDPTAGLAAGFRDLQDTFLSTGQILREGVLDLGHDLSRAFSDSFFNVVTGDFKKLSQLPQQFAASLVRTVTDALGKIAVGSVLKQLGFSAFLPTQLLAGGGVNPLTLLAGGGAGGNIPITAAQAASLQAQGILVGVSSTGEFAVQAATLQAAQASGGFGLPPLPTGLLPQPSFLAEALSAPVFLGSGVQAGLIGAEEAFRGASLIGTGALTAGQLLTGAAGAIGLGLTIFGALQGPPSVIKTVSSTVSGAFSGAAIGSLFPGPGTLIGAIAGGLIGGGASFFGKGGGGKKPSASERSTAAGQAGAAQLSAAIDNAQSLGDMVAILNAQWAPNGEVQILSYGGTADFPVSVWGRNPDNFPPGRWKYWEFTIEQLLDPEFVETIAIQVGQTGVVPLNAALTQKAKDKIKSLAKGVQGALAQVPIFGEAPGAMPGVTVATGVLGAAAAAELTGQQLSLFGELLLALPDELKAKFLRDLARLDYDGDLNLIMVDDPTGGGVTVSL